jgi:hypothetical protein
VRALPKEGVYQGCACYVLGVLSLGILPWLIRVFGRRTHQGKDIAFDCVQSSFWNFMVGNVAMIVGVVAMLITVCVAMCWGEEDFYEAMIIAGGSATGGIVAPNTALGFFWAWRRAHGRSVVLPVIGRRLHGVYCAEGQGHDDLVRRETFAYCYVLAALSSGLGVLRIAQQAKRGGDTMLLYHAKRAIRWNLVFDIGAVAILLVLAPTVGMLLAFVGWLEPGAVFIICFGGSLSLVAVICLNIELNLVCALLILEGRSNWGRFPSVG